MFCNVFYRRVALVAILSLFCSFCSSCGSGEDPVINSGSAGTVAATVQDSRDLGGPDANNNGIRDDIEEFIVQNYSASEEQRTSMLRLAATFRRITLMSESADDSLQNAFLLMRVMECTSAHFDTLAEWSDAVDSVRRLSFDTEARLSAYSDAMDHLDGQEFLSSPSDTLSCQTVERVFSTLLFQELEVQQCKLKRTKIYFGNGVKNDQEQAFKSLIGLKKLVKPSIPQQFGEIEFAVAYNYTGGYLKDLIEVGQQAQQTTEQDSLIDQIWGFVTGKPKEASVSDIIQREFVRHLTMKTTRTINALNGNAGESIFDDKNNELKITHTASYKKDIADGKRVIVVAHSQGNLFANVAYGNLTTDERKHFAIVGVATPDDNVAGATLPFVSPYTTSDQDLIIQAANAGRLSLNLGPALPPNIELVPLDSADITGHGFLEIYLEQGRTRRNIFEDIVDAIVGLPFPARAVDPLDLVPEIEPNDLLVDATDLGLSQIGAGFISPKAPDDPNTGLVDDTDHFTASLPLGVYDVNILTEPDTIAPTFGFLDGNALRKRVCLLTETSVVIQVFGGEAFDNTGSYSFEIVQAADYVASASFLNTSGSAISFRMTSVGQLINNGQTIVLNPNETFKETFDKPIEDLNIIEFSPVLPPAQDLGFAIDVPCGFSEDFVWDGDVLVFDQPAIPIGEGDCL